MPRNQQYCVVEFVRDEDTDSLVCRRIMGPFELGKAMKEAESYANDQASDLDLEVKELDVLDLEHQIGDSAGAFGAEIGDEPYWIFSVKPLTSFSL